MTILESVFVALFIIFIVFALLASIYFLIRLTSYIFLLGTKKKNSPLLTATEKPIENTTSNNIAESFSSGDLQLENVDEPTAAMIIALISDKSDIRLEELCFKRISLIDPNKKRNTEAGGHEMIYTIQINDKEYEVEVEKGKANILKTAPLFSPQSTEMPQETATSNKTSTLNISTEDTVVQAPIPGVVLDINATIGQQIKQGDLLLVLEAMKMENEISSPCNGTIKQILVTKGAAVATDDTLIVIEQGGKTCL